MRAMSYSFSRPILGAALLAGLMACSAGFARSNPVALPAPKLDATTATHGTQTAVFAGGCFWGVEGVFDHVRGVESATSGYSGGAANTAQYEIVSTGTTGHAESVKVVFDPGQVSYGRLLQVYFSVAHDPTQLNRQSPDTGTQYRSQIFTTNAAQQRIATAYISQLTAAKVFPAPIVTRVEPLKAFYPAEAYHQHYLAQHPDEPYIVFNDAPKLVHLKAMFPTLYKGG
jgi:peptide-methionine (S)-S-oxide reductase